METELWSNGRLFRTFTLAKGSTPETVSVRIASGNASMDVNEGAKRFGVEQESLVLAGYGREKWHWDISKPTAKALLVKFRTNATRAHFTKEGTAQLRQ